MNLFLRTSIVFWLAILFMLGICWSLRLIGIDFGIFTIFLSAVTVLPFILYVQKGEHNKRYKELMGKTKINELLFSLSLFILCVGSLNFGIGILSFVAFLPASVNMIDFLNLDERLTFISANFSYSIIMGALFGLLMWGMSIKVKMINIVTWVLIGILFVFNFYAGAIIQLTES